MFDMQSTGRGAAIIVEPIISAGGVLVPPKAFMQALRKAADDRGMLLIFDEAQTAFGRSARRLAPTFSASFRHHDHVEDAGRRSAARRGRTTAKIEDKLHDDISLLHQPRFRSAHGGGWPGCSRRHHRREARRARERHGRLSARRFEELQQKYEVIGDVRGAGPLLGVELVRSRLRAPAHELGALTTAEVLRERPEHEHPPPPRARLGLADRSALTVSTDEIDRAVEILDRALKESLDELARNNAA